MALTSQQQMAGSTDVLFEPSVEHFWLLLKPRVMSLVVFTGFAGMYVAPGGLHPLVFAIALFAIAAGAGASGAINQWYDRDIDAMMSRTKTRPIPAGFMAPAEALTLGLVVSAISVLLLGLSTKWLAASLLAFTIFFYAVVYTVWLKRRTPQNIVIGGAAGAFPPMIGWAAVTGTLSIEPILLFAIIFMWTPPHFWALALVKNDDYTRAAIPMLPVVVGAAETRRQIVIYAVLMAPLAIIPAFIGMASFSYGIISGFAGAIFIGLSVKLWRDGTDKTAMQLFGYSILYLFLVFLALVIDRFVAGWAGV
jgi:protoheme IX farnesyltransferase